MKSFTPYIFAGLLASLAPLGKIQARDTHESSPSGPPVTLTLSEVTAQRVGSIMQGNPAFLNVVNRKPGKVATSYVNNDFLIQPSLHPTPIEEQLVYLKNDHDKLINTLVWQEYTRDPQRISVEKMGLALEAYSKILHYQNDHPDMIELISKYTPGYRDIQTSNVEELIDLAQIIDILHKYYDSSSMSILNNLLTQHHLSITEFLKNPSNEKQEKIKAIYSIKQDFPMEIYNTFKQTPLGMKFSSGNMEVDEYKEALNSLKQLDHRTEAERKNANAESDSYLSAGA